MNTNWKLTTAAVAGARHQRAARNGQDAVASWLGADAAAIVVCDGCSAGAGSEMGARLGAQLVTGALARRLAGGAAAGDEAMWRGMRAETVASLALLLERLGPELESGNGRTRLGAVLENALRDGFLFTIVAAAVTRDEVAVWALGDGAYALGTSSRVLGPFADNAPPYLAYDLLGEPHAAHLRVESASCGSVVIATDGVVDLIEAGTAREHESESDRTGQVLSALAAPALTRPDALRRHLALLARSGERIDWDARRVVRTPAPLQDDCAVASLRWELPS